MKDKLDNPSQNRVANGDFTDDLDGWDATPSVEVVDIGETPYAQIGAVNGISQEFDIPTTVTKIRVRYKIVLDDESALDRPINEFGRLKLASDREVTIIALEGVR